MESVEEKMFRINRGGDLNSALDDGRRWSLADVHRIVASSKRLAELCGRIRACEDKSERKELKKGVPSVEFNSVCNGLRRISNVERMTGLIVVDIDNLKSVSQARTVRDNIFADQRLGCVLSFLSVSGLGVKAVLDIGTDRVTVENVKDWYSAVAWYLKSTYSLPIDTDAMDAVRLCFLSHDPDARIADGGRECSVDLSWGSLARACRERAAAARRERNAGGKFACRYDGNQLADLLRSFAALCARHGLSYLDEYGIWVGFGSGVRRVFGGSAEGLEVWDACSRTSPKYNRRDLVAKWPQLPEDSGESTVVGMLYNFARRQLDGPVNLRSWLHLTMRKLGMLGTTVLFDRKNEEV